LNGVTWFLPALFLMHMVTEFCNRQKHWKVIMLILTVICIILYGANKYYHYAPYITYHGFIRCLCFFFMANIYKQSNRITDIQFRKELAIGLLSLTISLLLFYWHIHEDKFVLHIFLYYIVNLFSVYGIICLCRCLNNIRSRLVTLISIGTMLIFGLHRILIGLIDFTLEKATHIYDITYNWYECLILALVIEVLLLPFIFLTKRHYPILLGKKMTK
jgi:hypothetical protein